MLTKIAKAAPFEGAPKINIASVFGASPKKPFLLRIPVSGQRPMHYSAENLPDGLVLQGNIISGSVQCEGNYEIILHAHNATGEDSKKLTLEIAPNHILLTPLMGFTTWNAFADRVTQKNVIDSAYNMIKHGIAEYGYRYVNLDSGWQYAYGGEFDAVQPNPKFPDLKAMTDEIHALGLKCGIYSTPMLTAWGCPAEYASVPGCTQGERDIRFTEENGGIGMIRKERNNAKQWEAWGFDYLKYDWEPTDPVNSELMRTELLQLNRDFGYCVTVYAIPQYVSYWSNYTNSYRNSIDAKGYWENLIDVYNAHKIFEGCMKKGHFYDLDMLDVGKSVFKDQENFLTKDEMVVAYSMRAFLNSPIQLSADLTEVDDFELSLYCNEEIIAINQDAAFSPATPVLMRDSENEKLHVYEKLLEDGSYAYALFNFGEVKENAEITFADNCVVRDVWAKEDLGLLAKLALSVHPHTVRIIKCSKKAEAIK